MMLFLISLLKRISHFACDFDIYVEKWKLFQSDFTLMLPYQNLCDTAGKPSF